jgi:hypothetical protein
MLSNQQRGRNIANDTAVQSVFLMLQHMYPELHRFIKSLDDKQGLFSKINLIEFFYILFLAYYESLQDKLSQLKDAREALNALRDDHLENKKRQALERERQRQVQLAVKLDDMRQKKQVKIFRKKILFEFSIGNSIRLIWNIKDNCIYNVWQNKKQKCKHVLINKDVMLNNVNNKIRLIIIFIHV